MLFDTTVSRADITLGIRWLTNWVYLLGAIKAHWQITPSEYTHTSLNLL